MHAGVSGPGRLGSTRAVAAWRAPGDVDDGGGGAPRAYFAELLAHPGRLAAALVATVVAAVVLWLAQPAAQAAPALARATPGVPQQPRVAGPTGVFRQAAASCPGLDWTVLAGIYAVETSSGTDAGRSSAGAEGPMQFLPATWSAFRSDGDHDGRADVGSLPDAALGAARMLCAHGAADPGRVREALFAYNHSDDYVNRVEAAALAVRRALTAAPRSA